MNSRRLWRALICGALVLVAAPEVRAQGTFDIPAGARFNKDKPTQMKIDCLPVAQS